MSEKEKNLSWSHVLRIEKNEGSIPWSMEMFKVRWLE